MTNYWISNPFWNSNVENDAQQQLHQFLLDNPNESEYVIQMPTGTGKSPLMCDLIFKYDVSCFVFPRLALLSQYYRDYLSTIKNINIKFECSEDEKVDKTGLDDFNSVELKNIESTIKLLKKAKMNNKNHKLVILTTYNSLSMVLDKHNNIQSTILDEAHHCNELRIQDLFDNKKELCGCIYHFTATPNDYHDDVKCSFKYHFTEAIEKRLIRDFNLHVILCSSKYKNKNDTEHLLHKIKEISQLLGIEQSKYMGFTALSEAEKDNRNNVTQLQKLWAKFDEYCVQGITSSTKKNDRNEIIEQFIGSDKDLSILLSCRTLSEGIDIKKVNGALFVDPRKNTREIIQIIGRSLRILKDENGVPLLNQPNAVIIIPVYIDIDEYNQLEDDEEKDEFIRDYITNTETGSFATVLNVVSALKQIDDDMFDYCMFYPIGCNKENKDRIKTYLGEQGYELVEVAENNNSFFNCLEKATGKNALELRNECVNVALETEANKEFAMTKEQVEDLREDDVWNIDASNVLMKVMPKLIEKQIRVHYGNGDVDVYGEDDNNGAIDLLLCEGQYSYMKPHETNKNEPRTNKDKENKLKNKSSSKKKKIFMHPGDTDMKVFWKLNPDVINDGLGELMFNINDTNETPLEKAQAIVQRALQRQENGCHLLPRCIHDKKNRTTTELEQEHKDAKKLQYWKQALKGKGTSKCSDEVRDYLDKEFIGWRDDFDKKAIEDAKQIVFRALKRLENGERLLPKHISKENRTTLELEQENKDANKLQYWKQALKGNGKKCSNEVRDYLDIELIGWRDENDYDENAMKHAEQIVLRALQRQENGGRLLPRLITNKENRTTTELEQENKDASKLHDWKNALKGKGNGTKCSDKLRDYLDKKLIGWRDELDFDKKAINDAKQIVFRALQRQENGRRLLPRLITNKENRTTLELEQENKDAIKLGHWKKALKGKGNRTKCSDEVRDYLDSNLPGWRDTTGDTKSQTEETQSVSTNISSLSSISISISNSTISSIPKRKTVKRIKKILAPSTSQTQSSSKKALPRVQRNQELHQKACEVGIYNDVEPPHLEAKNYINNVLATNKPNEGKIIVLDGINFRTSKTIGEPSRTTIVQFNDEHYNEMIKDEEYGDCLVYEQLTTYLSTLDITDPIGLIYADICGSIKEMRPILEQLSTKTFTKNAIVACTICARDGDKKEADSALDFTTELLLEMGDKLPGKWKQIGDKNKIKYGNMCTIILTKLN